MKKILLPFLFLVLLSLVYFQFSELVAFSSIPPSGRAGAPNDGSSCIGCHSGSQPVNLMGVIESDIPVEGYVPGETYSITIASGAERQGATRYGFQLTPQDDQGNLVGSLTQVSGTSVTGNGKYISHNGAQSTSSPNWTFEWTAPQAGAGDFSFYVCVVAANSNGSSSGDEVILSSMEIQENQTTSSANVFVQAPKIFATQEILSVEHSKLEAINMYDLNGKLVSSNSFPSVITDISNLKSGMYIVTIKAQGKWFREKIIK
jgi:hypothetical protein